MLFKYSENSDHDGLDSDSLDPEVLEIDPDGLDSWVLSEFIWVGISRYYWKLFPSSVAISLKALVAGA